MPRLGVAGVLIDLGPARSGRGAQPRAPGWGVLRFRSWRGAPCAGCAQSPRSPIRLSPGRVLCCLFAVFAKVGGCPHLDASPLKSTAQFTGVASQSGSPVKLGLWSFCLWTCARRNTRAWSPLLVASSKKTRAAGVVVPRHKQVQQQSPRKRGLQARGAHIRLAAALPAVLAGYCPHESGRVSRGWPRLCNRRQSGCAHFASEPQQVHRQ